MAAALFGALRRVTASLLSPGTHTASAACCSHVRSVSYDPYPKYDPTPDPLTSKKKIRYGYKYKFHRGGVLPRPEGDDRPLKMPHVDPRERDAWTKERALFGQNDYIDILGDGEVHPVQLITGPRWMVGFKGNEFQRIVRRLNFQGKLLRHVYPTRYHSMYKRLFYLYKKLNRRRHAPFWSGNAPGSRHRRIHFNKF